MIQNNLPSRGELARWYFKRLTVGEKQGIHGDFIEQVHWAGINDDELADWNWETNLRHDAMAIILGEYLAETRCPIHQDTLANGQFGGFCSAYCQEQQQGGLRR